MSATDAPGFYRVNSIIPTPVPGVVVGGTLPVTSIQFGYSPNQFSSNNEVTSAIDARFSSYQTAVVNFSYSETPIVAVGATASFDITVSYLPNIRDIQQLFQAPATRPLCGDYLVRAALPCYVSMNITLYRNSITDTAASIGTAQLTQDIFNYVNSLPFGQTLNVSKIVALCEKYSIQRVDLPLIVNGQIYTLNGNTINISSSDDLQIPVNYAEGVSPNTTLFFVDYFNNNSTNSILNIGINLV
jgi:hypothetical protein